MAHHRQARRSSTRALELGLALASAAALVGCDHGSVVRIVDGVAVEHRFISARAYASYARGVYAESQGRFADAVTAFSGAADADEAGVEPRTRLGAVSCKLGRFDDAARAFDAAEDRDPSFEPLWRERAKCDLARSDLKAALRDSARAEVMDAEREETILLHADVLERTGDAAGALREIVGLTTRRPSPTAWRRQLGLAERIGDVPAARIAKVALSLHPDAESPPLPSRAQRLELVDHHIDAGDVSAAARAGRAAKLSPAEVLVRAAAMARPDVARAEAERIAGAEPSSGDALVALVAAADQAREPDAIAKACDRARGAHLSSPSKLGVLVLLEVLGRRVGAEAVAGPAIEPSDDALEKAQAARVERVLTK